MVSSSRQGRITVCGWLSETNTSIKLGTRREPKGKVLLATLRPTIDNVLSSCSLFDMSASFNNMLNDGIINVISGGQYNYYGEKCQVTFNVFLVLIIECFAPASTADLHSLLKPVDDAAHTRKGPVAECLEGTRTDAIAEIVRCLDDQNRPICWVSGSAGSGKSALAQTIAKHYDSKGRLAASFFFLRGGGSRNTISRTIPTLAYQISLSIPATKPYIRDVVRKDPGIFNQGLKHQFDKLVSAPILAARATASEEPNPKVIVIDAL